MLDKWEDELEKKLVLAESDPARFLEWIDEIRRFGRPHMTGIVSGFTATAPTKLQAVITVANFLGPWHDLWLRIEERMNATGLELTEADQKRFQEAFEEARQLHDEARRQGLVTNT
jgi:hypothetical protein